MSLILKHTFILFLGSFQQIVCEPKEICMFYFHSEEENVFFICKTIIKTRFQEASEDILLRIHGMDGTCGIEVRSSQVIKT